MCRKPSGVFLIMMASMISQTVTSIGRALIPVFISVGLVACAGQSAVKSQPQSMGDASRVSYSVGQQAASIAVRQVGVPYRYGGDSPTGFDCSGLVHYSYHQAGKAVPRTTTQLWKGTSAVNRDEIQAGDILFFQIEGKMSHVGMYLGDNRFVHAPSSGKSVSIESLGSEFYRSAFVRAGRPR
jgi:cell wall-associated NlpC family hydrolase